MKPALILSIFLQLAAASPIRGITDIFSADAPADANKHSSNNVETEKPYYLRLSAERYYGKTFKEATKGSQPQIYIESDELIREELEKRDDNDTGAYDTQSLPEGSALLQMVNQNTFYLSLLEIGTPAQKVGVLVDTGSSDLWVVSSNNSYCMSGTTGALTSFDVFSEKRISEDSIADKNNLIYRNDSTDDEFHAKASSSSSSSSDAINCSVYGTFDSGSSETFNSNGTSFSITYADGTFANGGWGTDDLTVGDFNVTDMSFAVCDNADNAMGVLGIGLPGLETTYSGTTSASSIFSSPYQYENFPLRLKNLGLIKQTAYSVFLGSSNSDTADILFGAVDHSLYQDQLVALPILNTLESRGYDDPIQLEVTLNSVTLVNTDTNQQAVIGTGAAPALLDTGTTLTYVPPDVLSTILNLINARYVSSVGYYIVDCMDTVDYELSFNFQGLSVPISLSRFVISLQRNDLCMVGLQSSDKSSFTLGDNFLRSVYMVADYDNMEIGLALADTSGGKAANIEVLSTGIPNAVAPNSALEWNSKTTSLSVQTDVTMSAIPSTTTYSFQSKDTNGKSTTTKPKNTNARTSTSRIVSTITLSSKNGADNLAASHGSLITGCFMFLAALL